MMQRCLHTLLCTIAILVAAPLSAHGRSVDARPYEGVGLLGTDTLVSMEGVDITAIKHRTLKEEAAASTIISAKSIESEGIRGIKDVVTMAPNFFMPDYGSRITSSIYVRGLGTRIDQPVVGMNVDNVPVADKNMYDTTLPDIERIEILRGPQSTLYGRNTMCGVVNISTLSPLKYQGVRINADYGSRNTCNVGVSAYNKFADGLGASISAQFAHSDGYFRNLYDNHLCDKESGGNMRMKLQYRKGMLSIDNVIALTTLLQGGYPYAYAGVSEGMTEQHADLIGSVCYNDEASYRRMGVSEGFTLRYDWRKMSLSSITSYQYLNDRMVLDQDFLPLSYFTLTQAKSQHDLTQDIVLRSTTTSRYQWLVGAFAFFKHQKMAAPVTFKGDGIQGLILDNVNKYFGNGIYEYSWGDGEGNGADNLLLDSHFTTVTAGWAAYHQSSLRAGRWLFTLGIRLDGEHVRMRYNNTVDSQYTATKVSSGEKQTVPLLINDKGTLSKTFFEVLPRLCVMVDLDAAKRNNLYVSASKGYKAGGFNTQMFSEVLQRRLKHYMGQTQNLDIDQLITYKPEKSWNFEAGGHFSTSDTRFTADVALFWIECFDQQLTVFPEGQTTGRMMTNAGRTRSFGVEASANAELYKGLHLSAGYGYTNARFRKFVSGTEDYAGKQIPYAPEHTLSARLRYVVSVNTSWLHNIEVAVGCTGAGKIYWDEANTISQPFYALADASVRFSGKMWGVDIWGRNLLNSRYDVFYFESMGNRFLQRGKPISYGVRLSLRFLEN
ncbi:MAG: TonB-dependent receptor [Alistipes sp.]|nr:TonB-dependent receptor [Alistipes sp.]